MHRIESGDATVLLSGLSLVPGGPRRNVQDRGRLHRPGTFRDLRTPELGGRDAPGFVSLREVVGHANNYKRNIRSLPSRSAVASSIRINPLDSCRLSASRMMCPGL